MSKTPNLVWLRSFEHAARHMSFTAAAEELGITQTALSLHIRSLEAQLGCPLFFRAARHLSLTEVGQAYAFTVRRALRDIDLSTISLFGSSQPQELVVRVPISTASLFIAPRLPEFARKHPEVSIRLVSNIWAESTGRNNVDLELRVGTGDWNDAPFTKLSDERIVPIAGKSRETTFPSAEVLQEGPQIQILGIQDMWQRYLSAFDVQYSAAATPVTVDTTIAAVDIVAANGGYAVILERFAKTAIETGRSIEIVGQAIPFRQCHYLVDGQSSNANATAKQMFKAWLTDVFA